MTPPEQREEYKKTLIERAHYFLDCIEQRLYYVFSDLEKRRNDNQKNKR